MSGRGKDNKFRREGDLTDKEWSSVNRNVTMRDEREFLCSDDT